ncbi:hypothetical protein EW026_g2842 [Hermanssonia centrifuga]|uniref:Uncharacterized protein n=1 Tax=Hermanssonia centrifuga TaxID=98765 RepID=A0A4S4KMZ8_9APHY|nr:hypothetical protein EW026_g2842 [Hermanssonia centrifuga]
MVNFAPYPTPAYNAEHSDYGGAKRHFAEDLGTAGDTGVDFEDDDFEASGSKLTYPGETITSSHAFMRYEIYAYLDAEAFAH